MSRVTGKQKYRPWVFLNIRVCFVSFFSPGKSVFHKFNPTGIFFFFFFSQNRIISHAAVLFPLFLCIAHFKAYSRLWLVHAFCGCVVALLVRYFNFSLYFVQSKVISEL